MELTMHDGTVRELIFMENMSNYSSIVVSGGAGSCKICLTDCNTGQTFKYFTGHTCIIFCLLFFKKLNFQLLYLDYVIGIQEHVLLVVHKTKQFDFGIYEHLLL